MFFGYSLTNRSIIFLDHFGDGNEWIYVDGTSGGVEVACVNERASES